MKKIIFTADFLAHTKKHSNKFTLWVFKLFKPIIESALNSEVDVYADIINEQNKIFSIKNFYELGGITNIKENYNTYNTKEFNQEQIDYLKQFFDENTIVIGIELYKPLTDLLTSFGTTVIDLAFHSYKLFDDLAFGISTNNKDIYNQLLKYQIPQEKFYYYANYWKTFMEYNGMIQDSDLEDNSALFIGQTLVDKSVEKDGVFLNVTHFEDRLKELKEKYSKIYYLPHPYLGKKRKMIYDWVNKSSYIELLANRSTYGLLASDKIKKVVGISTSVLYEAQYFNKEVEYLYKPLFNIDAPFEEHSYISIFEDYWNPKFWADVLSPICEINHDVKDINHFKYSCNKLRDITNSYWGYAQLDPIKRIPNAYEAIKNLYKKYIAPHF